VIEKCRDESSLEKSSTDISPKRTYLRYFLTK
jgi:hypothetical protein